MFWIALLLGVLGAFVALLNLYLSFVRPRRHVRQGAATPYRHVSGFPLAGSLFLYAAALIWFIDGWHILAAVACAMTLADAGGPIWFAIAMMAQRNRTT